MSRTCAGSIAPRKLKIRVLHEGLLLVCQRLVADSGCCFPRQHAMIRAPSLASASNTVAKASNKCPTGFPTCVCMCMCAVCVCVCSCAMGSLKKNAAGPYETYTHQRSGKSHHSIRHRSTCSSRPCHWEVRITEVGISTAAEAVDSPFGQQADAVEKPDVGTFVEAALLLLGTS